MPTSNLGVPTLVAAQANKIVFINEAFEAFDQATQGVATHDAEDGDLTLTVEQFSAAYLLDFTGAPDADRNITLPANVRRSFGVRNSTGRPLTLQLDAVTDSGVELADGAVAAFVSTTTELLRMAGGGGGGDGITPAQVARLLPTFPDAGSRNDLIPKFDGDTLGWEADATGGGGAAITVEDEGTALATDAETLNFTGAGVTVTNDGTTASKKVINIPAATAGDGGLTAVETDATLTGDGTSGDALGIADGGVDTTQLADDAVTVDKVENALLARVPASALPAPSNANNGKVVGLTATAYAAVDAPAGGASITVEDEGTALATAAATLNFAGNGVTVTNDGSDASKKLITIPGGSSGGTSSSRRRVFLGDNWINTLANANVGSGSLPQRGWQLHNQGVDAVSITEVLVVLTSSAGSYRGGISILDGDGMITSQVTSATRAISDGTAAWYKFELASAVEIPAGTEFIAFIERTDSLVAETTFFDYGNTNRFEFSDFIRPLNGYRGASRHTAGDTPTSSELSPVNGAISLALYSG